MLSNIHRTHNQKIPIEKSTIYVNPNKLIVNNVSFERCWTANSYKMSDKYENIRRHIIMELLNLI